MTTETEHPTWGEEPPPQAAAPGSGWNGRKTLVAIAVAVGITAVGGGVIYAASTSDAAQGMGGPRGGGGLVMMGGPFGDTQHGEFQNGEVTEVSDTSITVKSPDGFGKTYALADDTKVNGGQGDLDDIAVGDVVTVVASESDGKTTVATIMEGNVQRGGGDGRQKVGPPPPADQDPADGQGNPPTR